MEKNIAEVFRKETSSCVFQIMPSYADKGYVGAFIIMDEWKAWGIQGSIPRVATRERMEIIPLRVEWEHLEFVGVAHLTI